MASVVISGDTSGAITLSAPAVAGTTTLTLPATSGTVLQSGTTVTEAQGGTGTTTGYYGFKNRIINGAMVIDQRNAGASYTVPVTSQSYTLDRWYVQSQTGGSKYTVQRNAGSVTPPAGFSNYLGVTVAAAANVTVGASDYYDLAQPVEGFNIADFAFGTASATAITISFWVRSSLTGTFGGSVRNGTPNRSYLFTYTISAANTWEQKSVTIAGDTTGTWATDNTAALTLAFSLGVGSTFSGTAGAWTAGNLVSPTGAVKLIETNSATFYITGVQLEKGSTATSFDYRPYGTELALCQRYYYKVGPSLGNDINLAFNGFAATTTLALLTVPFPVTMRTSPSALEQSGTSADYAVRYAGGSIANCSAVPNFQSSYTLGAQVGLIVASGLTAGGTISGRSGSATGNNSYFAWSAEL